MTSASINFVGKKGFFICPVKFNNFNLIRDCFISWNIVRSSIIVWADTHNDPWYVQFSGKNRSQFMCFIEVSWRVHIKTKFPICWPCFIGFFVLIQCLPCLCNIDFPYLNKSFAGYHATSFILAALVLSIFLIYASGSHRCGNRCIYWTTYMFVLSTESWFSILTLWGQDKIATITITQTFSNAFSRMKMYKLRLRFDWSLFQNSN